MAARPIASGTISFGLVAIPVKLFSPIESAKTVRFNNVCEPCGTRVKNKTHCPACDKMMERSELTKGYEFAKGQFVLFSPEELKALQPEATNAIEISEFIPLTEIDPIYFSKPYYLGPDKGGAKPYRLLAAAMRKTGRAALAKYAARGKNYLVLLRPFQDGLIMQQLHYADELRAFSEVPLGDAEVKDGEVQLALQLIDQTASDEFQPEKYEDTVRNQVWELIERKIQGEDIVATPEEAPKAQVIDLMEALKASLGEASAGERKPPKRSGKSSVDDEDEAPQREASGK
ncbi:MAG: Ku protein [Acidobacteriota bacterium]